MLNTFVSLSVPVTKNNDPVAIVERYSGLEKADDGIFFRFQTRDGKANRGRGIHRWPVEQAPDALATLKELIATTTLTEDLNSVSGRMRATWQVVDDAGELCFQYKLEDGAGSKPMRIPVSQAQEIISILENKIANIDKVLSKIEKKI